MALTVSRKVVSTDQPISNVLTPLAGAAVKVTVPFSRSAVYLSEAISSPVARSFT